MLPASNTLACTSSKARFRERRSNIRGPEVMTAGCTAIKYSSTSPGVLAMGPRGAGPQERNDVDAVMVLELGELAGEIAADDNPAVARLHGVREHDLGHAALTRGELGERRRDLGGVGGELSRPCGRTG